MRIIDLLTNSAARWPKRIAMKTENARMSYRQMLLEVQSLAEQLKSAGCRPGVKVAIVFGNSIEYLLSFFAISDAYGIIVPLSESMTPYEVARRIEGADVSIVITRRKCGERLLCTLSDRREITLIYVRHDFNKKLEIETTILGNCKADKENSDVALMVSTSGTTGLPKITMLTDTQLISNMLSYRSLMAFGDLNIVYCALPFHHIYCICAQILTHMSLADTFVISDKPFFVKDFLMAVEMHKINITAFVPYMGTLMAEFPDPHTLNLRSLKYVIFSGAKTPKSTYMSLAKKYHWVRFINTYGMSEAGSRISIAAPSPSRFPIESVGKPIPNVAVRIVNDSGNILPVSEIGEIQVKSSGVMKGYYKEPDLTASTIVNGWLKTGDIGKVDEEGNLFLVGRKKDIIISGGENIFPLEIEECLLEHPAIDHAAVVAKEDKLLQEVPCAFVVRHGACGEFTTTDIVKYCRSRLSSHKIPRVIRFLDKLPKLGTSKIDRNALRMMVSNGSYIPPERCP